MKGQGCDECEGLRSACWRRERNFDTVGIPHVFLGVIKHLGPIVPLINGLVGEGSSPDISCITLQASSSLRHLKYGSKCNLE